MYAGFRSTSRTATMLQRLPLRVRFRRAFKAAATLRTLPPGSR